MPSHLTRHVFRQILASQPILHRDCLRRRAYSTFGSGVKLDRRPFLQHASSTARPQRRTFFNFNMFARKKEHSKEADMDPGIEMMMSYAKMERLKARLPPPEDVADALKRFFAAKAKRRAPIEDTQALLALQAMRYCLDFRRPPTKDTTDGGSLHPHLSVKAFQHVIFVISNSRSAAADAHVALAKTIYDYLKDTTSSQQLTCDAARAFVIMLGATGQPKIAYDFAANLETLLQSVDSAGTDRSTTVSKSMDTMEEALGPEQWLSSDDKKAFFSVWVEVLWGFSRQSNEDDLLDVLSKVRALGVSSHPSIATPMLDFYLRRDDSAAVKTWFSELWTIRSNQSDKDVIAMGKELHSVLRWCLRYNELELGHHIVREAMADSPPKPIWDAIFVWAAGTGKGADEINRMMSIMEGTNESISNQDEWRVPDVETINALVEYAVSRNDPYMAERFIAIGKERDILPNAKTYVLQMEYRLKVNDVDGALVAYTNLQQMDLTSNDDVPTVNKLVVALCGSARHDFDTIMNVVADMSDRSVRFDPLTVSSLALLHLGRDEVADVVDLLNTHSYHYSSSEREGIRNKILEFCIDPKTSIPRSWDAYTVLSSIFDETPRSPRTDVMVNFFRRERPDMAVHVFNGMRAYSRSDTIPNVDTYVSAFLGSARLRDLESLEVVHNQLKLDFNINVDTYLNNALIIGYTACGKPRRAIDFWDDIVASREGPSYNSIHIALRACEKAPFGDLKAQEIWAKLRQQDVELDKSMWASYAAALAGNGDNDLAISTMEQAEANNEVDLDAFVVGSLFTGAAGQSKQAEIEAWAKEKYAQTWADLETIGFDVDEKGMRTAKIDRTVTP